jgi:hypothetical protein
MPVSRTNELQNAVVLGMEQFVDIFAACLMIVVNDFLCIKMSEYPGRLFFQYKHSFIFIEVQKRIILIEVVKVLKVS